MKHITLIAVAAVLLCGCDNDQGTWKYHAGENITSCIGGFRGVITARDDQNVYNGPLRYWVRYPTISLTLVHVIEPEICPADSKQTRRSRDG